MPSIHACSSSSTGLFGSFRQKYFNWIQLYGMPCAAKIKLVNIHFIHPKPNTKWKCANNSTESHTRCWRQCYMRWNVREVKPFSSYYQLPTGGAHCTQPKLNKWTAWSTSHCSHALQLPIRRSFPTHSSYIVQHASIQFRILWITNFSETKFNSF